MNAYDALVLALSPIGYWRCGDVTTQLADSSGNGNHAVKIAGVQYPVGQPLTVSDPSPHSLLDGSSYWRVTGTLTPAPVVAPFTVMCWAGVSGVSAAYQDIFTTRGPTSFGFGLAVSPAGLIHWDIGNGAAWLANGDSTGVGMSQPFHWHHIAMVVTNLSWTVYYEGEQLATGALAGSALLWNATHLPTIGALHDGTERFAGHLARLAVWNIALSAPTVAEFYAAGGPGAAGGNGSVQAELVTDMADVLRSVRATY